MACSQTSTTLTNVPEGDYLITHSQIRILRVHSTRYSYIADVHKSFHTPLRGCYWLHAYFGTHAQRLISMVIMWCSVRRWIICTEIIRHLILIKSKLKKIHKIPYVIQYKPTIKFSSLSKCSDCLINLI